MTTKQQQETLEYFRKHAEDWRSKAVGGRNDKANVIEQRNEYILQVEDERPATRCFSMSDAARENSSAIPPDAESMPPVSTTPQR